MMGIFLSLVLRGACIVIGAAAIDQFSWIFYLFGIFLVYTAIRLARGSGPGHNGYHDNAMMRRAQRVLPVSDQYDGARVMTRVRGRRTLTPMIVVFLAIGSTDLLFALDSIPAIFGLTQDPFVVFTATLFALMGLRQLYFLLGGLLDRLVYLSAGLSVILGFIGIKLILEALDENELPFLNHGHPIDAVPSVPISVSLGTIVVVLAVTTVASLVHSRRSRSVGAVGAATRREVPVAGQDGHVQPAANGVRRPPSALPARTAGPPPRPSSGGPESANGAAGRRAARYHGAAE
jgi:tellurite resistance protein TerC